MHSLIRGSISRPCRNAPSRSVSVLENRQFFMRPSAVSHLLEGDSLTIEFDLPRGAFATSVLRELLDVRVPESDAD